MELRQLRYFLAIADEGLITKAAARLHITQPPLSQQMLLLEKELGVSLFRRTKKHIQLTEAGMVFRQRAEQIMKLVQVTTDEVGETAGGLRGKLTIGIINTSGRLLLPEIVRTFHRSYPLVTFDLRQADSPRIFELMNSHQIDIGFVRQPVDTSRYETVTIPPEKLVLVGHRHLMKANAETLTLEDFRNEDLLLHRRYEEPLKNYFQRRDWNPNILCTSDEILPLLSWALLELGVAIVPEFSVNLITNPDLVVRKLTNPIVTGSSTLIWRKNEALPATATHFLQIFQQHLAKTGLSLES
jgi:DNA-binding transcriptional LysR family regulator